METLRRQEFLGFIGLRNGCWGVTGILYFGSRVAGLPFRLSTRWTCRRGWDALFAFGRKHGEREPGTKVGPTALCDAQAYGFFGRYPRGIRLMCPVRIPISM